ncbi:hypothetical protein DFJ73DRAFT_842133 [Zopfochytrium polystomum]|nr:hypothetical protein DFJ73DRAFT_842133 [Zopfochytrium polystomum]
MQFIPTKPQSHELTPWPADAVIVGGRYHCAGYYQQGNLKTAMAAEISLALSDLPSTNSGGGSSGSATPNSSAAAAARPASGQPVYGLTGAGDDSTSGFTLSGVLSPGERSVQFEKRNAALALSFSGSVAPLLPTGSPGRIASPFDGVGGVGGRFLPGGGGRAGPPPASFHLVLEPVGNDEQAQTFKSTLVPSSGGATTGSLSLGVHASGRLHGSGVGGGGFGGDGEPFKVDGRVMDAQSGEFVANLRFEGSGRSVSCVGVVDAGGRRLSGKYTSPTLGEGSFEWVRM